MLLKSLLSPKSEELSSNGYPSHGCLAIDSDDGSFVKAKINIPQDPNLDCKENSQFKYLYVLLIQVTAQGPVLMRKYLKESVLKVQ